ncbi:uncharacterized protein LOC127844178 [Dreissena polymorpha]|uniref:uncharacterized protein LOC127844178 n=1 Tax=Dreissena polymorpha TaxID=45954 RepID=UPI00226527BA|nr:uncharacterized protein LOC127844178 [Dreissena polymorpha]
MKVFSAFVFVVCCTGFCGAIRCYSCDSNINYNCADKFSASGITVYNSCVQCSKGKGETSNAYSTVQYVIRGCESSNYSDIGCINTKVNLVDVNICYCNTDLCNSGPRVATRFAIGVVPLIIFLRCL